MEERKKKEGIIYSPMKMTEALKEMGESYTRKDAVLYYCALLLAAVILGLLFELKPLYLIIVGITYLAFVPQIIYNQKKQAYELRRFNDVNAYMSQMAQSFTSKKNILNTLDETGNTFSKGLMNDALMKAIDILVSSSDVDTAKKEAFEHIERLYGCEKLKNLHAFLLMADNRGGDCEVEFTILETTRMAWEKAVNSYRKELLSVRNVCAGLYALMLGICVVIMNAFPEDLSIIQLELIQVVNTVLLAVFIVFFVFLDTRINGSLLKDAKYMSKEMADNYFGTLQGVTSDKEKRKYVAYPIITAIAVIMIFIMNPTPIMAALGIVLVLVMANMQRIILKITLSSLKSEIMKAFPKWLFDIMLLMQRESVSSAILNSLETAPPVMQAELNRICNMIRRDPSDKDAYMSFFADFNMPMIETSMRKLYSLSVGTGGNGEVMRFIIETNMELLTEAEKKSIEMKADTSTMYQFVPMFITSIGMLIYCVALMLLSLSQIWSLFE